jgi:hypothetical protein
LIKTPNRKTELKEKKYQLWKASSETPLSRLHMSTMGMATDAERPMTIAAKMRTAAITRYPSKV